MKTKQTFSFLATLLVNSALGPLSAHCKTNVKTTMRMLMVPLNCVGRLVQ